MFFELKRQQKKAIRRLINQATTKDGDMIHFYEGGTGTGKTTIMLHAALKIADKLGKPVVLATNNNKLVVQLSQELEKFEELQKNKKRFKSMLGAQNYIAPNRMSFFLDDVEEEAKKLEKIMESEEDVTKKAKMAEEIRNQRRFVKLSRQWLNNTLANYQTGDSEWDGLFYRLEDYLTNQGLVDFDYDLKFLLYL
jgi:Rad3-related DNA helicase